MVYEASALNFKTDLTTNVNELLNVSFKDVEQIMHHYNITHDILKDLIENIREWYKKQPHLPQGKLHDRQILGHLMVKGFSSEAAKRNIDNNFAARHKLPDILSGRNPTKPELAKYLKRGYWIVLPRKTEQNNRVTIYRSPPNDVFSLSEILKVAFMTVEYRIWNEAAIGDHWIMDFKNATVQQSLQFTPVMIWKIMYFLTSCFGTRLKSVHFINMPSYGVAILNIFKKSMASKMVNRFHISSSDEGLEQFSKDIMPIEYGGNEVSCQEIADKWLETFQSEEWTNYLEEQEKALTDESKRLTIEKFDENLGVNGSFRQLSLD